MTITFTDRLTGRTVYQMSTELADTAQNRCRLLRAAYAVGPVNFTDPTIAHRFS